MEAYTIPKEFTGLFGISTHKVYPIFRLLVIVVCSYHTFSPLPRRNGAVIFCDPICLSYESPPIKWCDASCCPDFPRTQNKYAIEHNDLQR